MAERKGQRTLESLPGVIKMNNTWNCFSTEDLLRLKSSIEASTSAKETLASLKRLDSMNMTIKHLEDTKVGRAVRKARDRHPDPEVQILADKMIEKWKDMVAEEYIRSKKAQAAVKKVQPAPAGPGKTLGGGGGGGGGFGGGGSTTSSVQSNTNRTGAAGAGAGQQMTIEGMMGRRGAVRGTGKFKK